MITMIAKRCLFCNKKYTSKLSEGRRYCSGSCGAKSRGSGEMSNSWRGGIRDNNGYVKIYSPNHPLKDKTKCVMEHRLVMEKKIGRYLRKEERVHHINGNRRDNRLKNLILFSNHSKHLADHHNIKARNSIGRFAKL